MYKHARNHQPSARVRGDGTDVGHRPLHGAGAGQGGHGDPRRPRSRQARAARGGHRPARAAGGLRRVRSVPAGERGARRARDRRDASLRRRRGQQRGHHAGAADQERARLGHVVRHQPRRPLRLHPCAHPPPPRRRERPLRRLRRRGIPGASLPLPRAFAAPVTSPPRRAREASGSLADP